MHSDLYLSTRENARLFSYGYTCHRIELPEHCTDCETLLVRYSVHSGGKHRAFSSLNTPLFALSGALDVEPTPSARWLGDVGTAFRPPIRTTHHTFFPADLLCGLALRSNSAGTKSVPTRFAPMAEDLPARRHGI